MSLECDEDAPLSLIRDAMRAFLKSIPNHYEPTRKTLARLNDMVREETACALQRALNDRTKRMPQATYDEKKNLAIWLNSELREFGLSIRCPKTGHSTILHANPSHDRDVGRFRFDRLGEATRYTTTFTSIELPDR